MTIAVENTTVTVTTPRLGARFEGPCLVHLAAAGGPPLVRRAAEGGPAGLELLFVGGEVQPLGQGPYARVQVVRVSETVAHVHVEDLEGSAALRISTDREGRLLVEPSAHTARPGLAGVRWNVGGIADGLELVAPLWQGCRQALEHPLVANATYEWPFQWEAALAILQDREGGWSVCAHDAHASPKALTVGHADDARTLGLATYAHGPWDGNNAVGSLAWIVDVHGGEWQEAAGAYRDWLQATCRYDRLRSLRPEWADEVRFTLQWCPCDPAILEATARLIEPRRVLIHVPAWRSDPYDVNYPEYTPSAEGRRFIALALEKGFQVLPHFNYFAIDPNHPAFARLSGFVMRHPSTKRLMGWRWANRKWSAFPQGHAALRALRDEKVMAYLHAGASPWRRLLTERIARAAAELGVPGVFVDQTLCAWNLDNALVENLTSAQGMVALTRELCDLDGALAVGGEGLNEISVQYETFAQAHLFKSHHANCERFEELNPVPLGHFLYGDLCRTMGYAGLAGDTPESALRLEVHEKLGALPSLTIRSAEELASPTPAVQRVIERARG